MHTMLMVSEVNKFFSETFSELGFITQPTIEYSPELQLTPELRTKFSNNNEDEEWISMLFDRSPLRISSKNNNRLYKLPDMRVSSERRSYDTKQVEVTINYAVYSNSLLKLEWLEEVYTMYFSNSVKIPVRYVNKDNLPREYIIGLSDIQMNGITQVDYETSGSLHYLTFSVNVDYTLDILSKLDKALSGIVLRFGFGNCFRHLCKKCKKQNKEPELVSDENLIGELKVYKEDEDKKDDNK